MRSNYFYLYNFLSLQVKIAYLFLSLVVVVYKSLVSSKISLNSALLSLIIKAKLVISKEASNRSISFLVSSITTSKDIKANFF